MAAFRDLAAQRPEGRKHGLFFVRDEKQNIPRLAGKRFGNSRKRFCGQKFRNRGGNPVRAYFHKDKAPGAVGFHKLR
jgi:hypothetical protein